MATRRSTRVTNVDPWIPGGEGQLRDLFPMPPALILFGRFLALSFRHWLITITTLVAIILWIWGDWGWGAAFLLFPIIIFTIRATAVTLWLWYKNPTIPLIVRKR